MKLRVAYLLESFDLSGAGRQVMELAKGLPRDEFDVHVAALGPLGPLTETLAATGVSVQGFDRRRRFDPAAFLRLRYWLARWRPQILHTWQFAANTYGRLAANADCRLVASERSIDLWKGWLEETVDRWLLSRTACVVMSCQTVRDAYLLRRGFGRCRGLTIIQPGVAPLESGSRSGLLEQLGLTQDAILIAAVGRLTRDQCYTDMIWAVEILGALFPQLHLLIVGDGLEHRRFERLAGCLRRTDLIHFMGQRDAAAILPHADMLWHAGAEDRLPSAVLEAMAAGVPVVACDTPGLRELITPGETGLLFPLGDRPGLARCTQKLLQDRALAKRLAANAQRHVAERFGVQAMIERHAQLYRSLM